MGRNEDEMQAGAAEPVAEAEIEEESLEDLLRRAVGIFLWVKRFAIWLAVGIVVLVVLFAVGLGLLVWDTRVEGQRDRDEAARESLELCQRGNGRSEDLIGFAEKIQELLGGPGAVEEADQLVEYARSEFLFRDCNGDGEITDADLPPA